MFNKVILIGRVGKDPELNATTSGVSVAKFTLATSMRYKDRSGESRESTEWHTIRCWRQTAEFVSKYCKAGTLVSVEGKLKTETWEHEGQKRSQTIVECQDLQVLAWKDSANVKLSQDTERDNEDYEPQPGDLPF